MWRHFNWSKDQSISDPMLFDTSMDQEYLETIPEVDSLKSARSSIAVPNLPELPFRSVDPLRSVHQEADDDRSSSVYSHYSPLIPQEPPASTQPMDYTPQNSDTDLHRRVSSLYSAVSPLHTPRNSGDLRIHVPDSPDVSPVEVPYNYQQFPTQQQKTRSLLPVLRKATPDAGLGITERKTGTRWDDYSGEPTDSEKGKQSVVKPGTLPAEMQYPDLKEKTREILAGLRERDQTRAATAKAPPSMKNESLDTPAHREPWKGASGRTALVNPVRNNPAARLEPIRIPANSGRRVGSNTSRSEESDTTPSTAILNVSYVEDVEEVVKPPAPLKLGKNSPKSRSPIVAEFVKPLKSPFQSPQHLDTVYASVTVPTASLGQPLTTSGPLTPVTPTPAPSLAPPPRLDIRQELTPRNSASQLNTDPQGPRPNKILELSPEVIPNTENPNQSPKQSTSDSSLQKPDVEHDPSSRFSWTTYATTVNGSSPGTPRLGADIPPVPSVRDLPTPLVMRKRPVQSLPQNVAMPNSTATEANVKVVARKPTPADRRRASTLMTTASDFHKTLPQCPPEIEAIDKISTLEARMEEFARRKRNVHKLIRQLTGPQTSAAALNPKARDEVKRTIAGLESELADIVQEEHDVGLRLHRVQRKKDRDENYDSPTGLWIKRVTSYGVDMKQ